MSLHWSPFPSQQKGWTMGDNDSQWQPGISPSRASTCWCSRTPAGLTFSSWSVWVGGCHCNRILQFGRTRAATRRCSWYVGFEALAASRHLTLLAISFMSLLIRDFTHSLWCVCSSMNQFIGISSGWSAWCFCALRDSNCPWFLLSKPNGQVLQGPSLCVSGELLLPSWWNSFPLRSRRSCWFKDKGSITFLAFWICQEIPPTYHNFTIEGHNFDTF